MNTDHWVIYWRDEVNNLRTKVVKDAPGLTFDKIRSANAHLNISGVLHSDAAIRP